MDAPFLGFPETQAFLADLKANNERGWFQAREAVHQEGQGEGMGGSRC